MVTFPGQEALQGSEGGESSSPGQAGSYQHVGHGLRHCLAQVCGHPSGVTDNTDAAVLRGECLQASNCTL